MRRYAVIGNPVRHSRSPWLHTAFAAFTQRNLVYAALQPRGDFADCAREFFARGGSGLNITLPYKAEALAFADHASAFAAQCGAANVLQRQADGSIRAANTDGSALCQDLQRLAGSVPGKKILLLGAGGAARAAAFALQKAGGDLWIHNRTTERAQQLAAACGAQVAEAPTAANIVINATAAGHHASGGATYPAEIFAHALLAYDLSYGAAARDFTQQAAAGGAKQVADGSGMLVWQAALSFALWEGVMPPVQAVLAELQKRGSK